LFAQINATAALMNPQMLQKHPELRYQEITLQTSRVTWQARTTPMMVLLEVSADKCVSHVYKHMLVILACHHWLDSSNCCFCIVLANVACKYRLHSTEYDSWLSLSITNAV